MVKSGTVLYLQQVTGKGRVSHSQRSEKVGHRWHGIAPVVRQLRVNLDQR